MDKKRKIVNDESRLHANRYRDEKIVWECLGILQNFGSPIVNSTSVLVDISLGLAINKECERRPRSPATHRGMLENFVGEEAPEARVGPRNRRSR